MFAGIQQQGGFEEGLSLGRGRPGLGKFTDERAQNIIRGTADLMGWDRAHLDHSTWRYMGQSHCRADAIEPAPGAFDRRALKHYSRQFEAINVPRALTSATDGRGL